MLNEETQNSNETGKETIEIKNIGKVLHVDSEGYLTKQALTGEINEPWKELTDEMIDIYKDVLGDSLHSIYIRGSLARGTAVEGISDADSIAVVSLEPGSFTQMEELLREKAIELEKKYPFAIYVELQAKPLQPIIDGENRIFNALLQTTASCKYGEDLTTILPKIKPGPEAVVVSYSYPRILNEAIERFSDEDFDVKPWHCRKLMRNTLRAGFEIVMEREQVWTRDLYPSYEYFSKNYPKYKKDMEETLFYALNPMTNRKKVLSLANNLGRFIETQIDENL